MDFATKRWIGGLNLLSNRGRHYHTHVFEALIEDINAQVSEGAIDKVVVTGDITNLALEQEFVFARKLFDRFQLPPEAITVIPGNHDAYVKKGAEYFAEHFADFFRSDDGSQTWPLVRTREGITFIGLSTSLQTPWFTAYGVIGDEQLAVLEAALKAAEGTFRVVLIHHPPVGRRAANIIRGLKDHPAFHRVLGRAGCELVLHGHEHQDLVGDITGPGGPIPVRGIQSATYEAGNHQKRARYRIYEIQGGAVAGEEVRVWDPASKRFGAEAGYVSAFAS